MQTRRITSMLLALVVVLGLALPAMAATGYGPGTVDPDPYEPSYGGGGGGSVENAAPATPAEVSSAIAAAAAAGNDSASLRNVETLPASTLQAAFAKNPDMTLQLDVVAGGAVQSRMYIDKETADKLSGTVDFSVSIDPKDTAATENLFEKYFDNDIAVVSFGQQGAFGADIDVAVKLDLSKLDTNNLVFYSYDKATNTFVKLPSTAYYIDRNGYLHFTTPVGGEILITDKNLAPRGN